MSKYHTESEPIDFAILTALEEEREALHGYLQNRVRVAPNQDDLRVYYRCDLPVTLPDGQRGFYRLVSLSLAKMGRINAATATADAIRRWRPRYLLVVGIAGGLSDAGVDLGDVLVSDQIVDYELQKLLLDGPEVRYEVHRADQRLLEAATDFPLPDWSDLRLPQRPRKGQPRRHIGPIATGDKVDAAGVVKRYRGAWPKLIGIEMEAGGAATAAFQSTLLPGFFVIRGVSDMADPNKSTAPVRRWRKYACAVAAAYTVALLRNGPVPFQPDTVSKQDQSDSSLTPTERMELYENIRRSISLSLTEGLRATARRALSTRTDKPAFTEADTDADNENEPTLLQILDSLTTALEKASRLPQGSNERITPGELRGVVGFVKTAAFDMIVRQVYVMLRTESLASQSVNLQPLTEECTALLSIFTSLTHARTSPVSLLLIRLLSEACTHILNGADLWAKSIEQYAHTQPVFLDEGNATARSLEFFSSVARPNYQEVQLFRSFVPPADRRAAWLHKAPTFRCGPQVTGRQNLRPSSSFIRLQGATRSDDVATVPPFCSAT
jgi:nucleoside phosphorylase